MSKLDIQKIFTQVIGRSEFGFCLWCFDPDTNANANSNSNANEKSSRNSKQIHWRIEHQNTAFQTMLEVPPGLSNRLELGEKNPGHYLVSIEWTNLLQKAFASSEDFSCVVEPNEEKRYLRVNFMKLGSDILATAWSDISAEKGAEKQSQNVAEVLKQNVRGLSLVSEVALLLGGTADFAQQVNGSLKTIGKAAGVSRIYIFEDSKETTSNTFEWCAPGITSQISDLKDFPKAELKSWYTMLQRDGKVIASDIQTLPADIVEILEPQGIVSIMIFPLALEGRFLGFIGFDQCDRIRDWSESEKRTLQSIAGLFSQALGRRIGVDRLVRSRGRLNNIIEATKVGTWEWNVQTGETRFNRYWAEIIGYSLEELSPISIETWQKHAHPEDLKKSGEALQDHFDGKSEFYDIQARMRHKDGHWVWVWDRGKVISRDENGQPLWMYGTHEDVTATKERERQLRRVQQAVEFAAENVVITDLDGRIVYVNPAFEKTTGYSKEFVKGKNPRILKSGRQGPEVYKNLWETISSGGTWEGEFVNRKKDKSLYVEDVRVAPVRDDEGEIINYIAIKRDITERKQVLQQLEEQRTQLDLFFSQSLDGFFFMMLDEPVEWNKDTDKEKTLDYVFKHQRITRINDAMLMQYRAHAGDFLGKTPADFFAHDIEQGRAVWREFFDQGQLHIDTTEERFDGEKMMVEGDYICLYDQAGHIKGHFGVQRDITKERTAFQKLAESEKKLQEIAVRDGLTGLYNRRHLFERLAGIFSKLNRRPILFTLAILDVDFFKKINDTYGHQCGDYVLKHFADLLITRVRPYDLVGRYGGEEFLLLLKETDLEMASAKLGKILEEIVGQSLQWSENSLQYSFSAGVACSTEFDHTLVKPEQMIELADKRLYYAKENGRSQVCTDCVADSTPQSR